MPEEEASQPGACACAPRAWRSRETAWRRGILAWLTGFNGSAGFAIATARKKSPVFVDVLRGQHEKEDCCFEPHIIRFEAHVHMVTPCSEAHRANRLWRALHIGLVDRLVLLPPLLED